MCGPLECIFCELCLPLTGTPSGGRNSEMRRHRGLARIASCSPDPYATFEWMCGPIECIFSELCLPLTGTPSGGRNSEMRRHRGLDRIAQCSPDPYATFEWMCGPLECIFFCELCVPLTGTPSGGRNTEMRRHRGLARIASCSPDPYATFEWMCGPLECIFLCELCLPLTGTPSGGRN